MDNVYGQPVISLAKELAKSLAFLTKIEVKNVDENGLCLDGWVYIYPCEVEEQVLDGKKKFPGFEVTTAVEHFSFRRDTPPETDEVSVYTSRNLSSCIQKALMVIVEHHLSCILQNKEEAYDFLCVAMYEKEMSNV